MLKKRRYQYPAIAFAVFLFSGVLWLKDKFGSVTLDQIIYHFEFGSEGLLTADPAFAASFIRACVLIPLLAVIIVFIFNEADGGPWYRFLGGTYKKLSGIFKNSFGKLTFVRRVGNRIARYALIYSFVLLAASVGFFFYNFPASGTIKNRLSKAPDYYADHYIDPQKATFTKGHLKNLVLIYAESLKNTYEDSERFGENLLQPLLDVRNKEKGFSFASFSQMPGTAWTIAGIVGTQCGIPLKSMTMYSGNKQGEKLELFLPHATCLGEILKAYDYRNVYMRGASMKFAGADKFFKAHGYDEIYGREEWLVQGYRPEHMNKWGLYDEDLFAEAKLKLAELMQKKERFNLTLLTLDTHHPKGNLSRICARKGYDKFEDTVRCSSEQIADFIRFIDAQGWSIQIVVMGDHLAMKNPVYEKLTNNADRTIFNMFLSDNKNYEKNRDHINHFDMMPTILNFVGLKVQGDRLGLGYSGIGAGVTPPEDAEALMQERSLAKSEIYSEFWKQD